MFTLRSIEEFCANIALNIICILENSVRTCIVRSIFRSCCALLLEGGAQIINIFLLFDEIMSLYNDPKQEEEKEEDIIYDR